MILKDRPVRVQLSRRKGWRMPENTVSVARPSKWGNPSYVMLDQVRPTGEDDDSEEGPWFCGLNVADKPKLAGFWFPTREAAVNKAVEVFRWRMTGSPLPADVARRELLRAALRGKNLACWCALVDAEGNRVPCHADVLLELANTEQPS